MFVIVSDLHLGCGDAREDFLLWGDKPEGPSPADRPAAVAALESRFARFLARQMARAQAAGWTPTLLLLGDTFELWQVRQPNEAPARALERILSAHPAWVTALRAWTQLGGALELVVGNHDQPVVDPEAWALLTEVFPTLNASRDRKAAHFFADAASGLYAEHGHRWDPYNRIKRLDRADASCAGREVVRTIANPLEPMVPWIDKAANTSDLIRIAEKHLAPSARSAAYAIIKRLARNASSVLEALLPWRDGREAKLDDLSAREVERLSRSIERALAPRPRGTTGPVPVPLRFLVSGHTHEALHARTRHHSERLNPGTWRPLALIEEDGSILMTQTQQAVVVAPDERGGWRASLERENS